MRFIKKLEEGLGEFPEIATKEFRDFTSNNEIKDLSLELGEHRDYLNKANITPKEIKELLKIKKKTNNAPIDFNGLPSTLQNKAKNLDDGGVKFLELINDPTSLDLLAIDNDVSKKTTPQVAQELIQKQLYDPTSGWDKNQLTKKYSNVLESHIDTNGWDAADPFLIWLKNTDNKNISALDMGSAKKLIEILNKNIKGKIPGGKEVRLNGSNYLLLDNNLFTGASKDIIYKLNALSMVFDETVRNQYIKVDGRGNPIVRLKGTNIELTPKYEQLKDKNGKPLIDSKTKEPKMGNVYYQDNQPIYDTSKIEPWHPSIQDMLNENGETFLDTNQIIKNFNGFTKEKVNIDTNIDTKGKDKEKSKDKNEDELKRTPTLYDIINQKYPNYKKNDFNTSITFNKLNKDLKDLFKTSLEHYYEETQSKNGEDIDANVEKAWTKLFSKMSTPKQAKAFWAIRPKGSDAKYIGSAIINQYLK